MFDAVLISLEDGQSYRNVKICETQDLDKYNIPMVFENWTGCFFADNKAFVVHHWKIKVIQMSTISRGGSFEAERLVLDGDITYAPVKLIDHTAWGKLGIPEFFVRRDGIAGQMAWSCPQGIFITHDTNVTSIIIPDPRPSGITSASQPGVDSITPIQIIKASSAPETMHGSIKPKK